MPPFQPSSTACFQAPSSRFSSHETAGAQDPQSSYPHIPDRFHATNYDHPSRKTAGAQTAGLGYTDRLAQAIGQIAEVSRQNKLPTCEIPTFDGNPRSYQRFIQTFKLVVETNTCDPSSRLNLLIQYTSGEARVVIEDCVLLEPKQGYERAKQLLKQNFGNSYDIARTYIDGLIYGKTIDQDDPKKLLDFSRELTKTEDTLTALGYTADINATSNLLLIVNRLPGSLQEKWADQAFNIQETEREPTFHDLSDFVMKQARVANSTYGKIQNSESNLQYSDVQQNLGQERRPAKTDQSHGIGSINKRIQKPCAMCDSPHSLWNCKKFLECAPNQRNDFVKEKRLCFNCLGTHKKDECRSQNRCHQCHNKHHTLLHDADYSLLTESNECITEKPDEQASTTTVSTTQVGGKSFLRILPVKVTAGTKSVTTLALLDDGSQATLCSSDLIKRLHAVTKPSKLNITTIIGQSNNIKSSTANLKVSSITGENTIELNDINTLPKLPISIDAAAHLDARQDWTDLSDIITEMKEQCNDNGIKDDHPVELLIGVNTPEAFWIQEQRRSGPGQPFAQRTQLGWTIQGPKSTNTSGQITDYSAQHLERSQPQCLETPKSNYTNYCPRTSYIEPLPKRASHVTSLKKKFDRIHKDKLSAQAYELQQPSFTNARNDNSKPKKANTYPTQRHVEWKMFPPDKRRNGRRLAAPKSKYKT